MYDYIIKINLTGYFMNETNASERFTSKTNTGIRPVIKQHIHNILLEIKYFYKVFTRNVCLKTSYSCLPHDKRLSFSVICDG